MEWIRGLNHPSLACEANSHHRFRRGQNLIAREMDWLAQQLGARFTVQDSRFTEFVDGDAAYRFFELFDLPNLPNAKRIFELAQKENSRHSAAQAGIRGENAVRAFVEPPICKISGGRNLARIFWCA